MKAALVVTLAGNYKLADYFEWGCRTIGNSKDLFDMLVFHESNTKLVNVTCAENVKLIDVGKHGLSQLVVKEILSGTSSSSEPALELQKLVNGIILHSPRYLVELKPMTGSLFANHLKEYSHWSYTDPNIIWGNLTDWIDPKDVDEFDVITIAKNLDSARLFLRGQFTLHKNTHKMNNMWRKLEYFSHLAFVSRIGSADRMLAERKPTDEVFRLNFESAEGWYSQLIFKDTSLSVKVVGRAFDDYFREAVVLRDGRLSRCALSSRLGDCIANATSAAATGDLLNVSKLPPISLVDVSPVLDVTRCKMHWLPTETRFCLASAVYDKAVALAQDTQTARKLLRVGEAQLQRGQWRANDEMVSRRQSHSSAAFFQFGHWDQLIRTSVSTSWPSQQSADFVYPFCMVLYLRHDGALAFESCQHVVDSEAASDKKSLLLHRVALDGRSRKLEVGEVLSAHRKQQEAGAEVHEESRKKRPSSKRGEVGDSGEKKPHLRRHNHPEHKGHEKKTGHLKKKKIKSDRR